MVSNGSFGTLSSLEETKACFIIISFTAMPHREETTHQTADTHKTVGLIQTSYASYDETSCAIND